MGSPTRATRQLSVLAGAAVALALLPIIGLGLAWVTPPALFAPPPLGFERLLPLIGRTLALALVVALGATVLGTWITWVGAMSKYRGRHLAVIASLLPLAVPSYVLATVTREVLAPPRGDRRTLGPPRGRDWLLACRLGAHLGLRALCSAHGRRDPLSDPERRA